MMIVDKRENLMDDLASTSVLEVLFTKLRFCTQNFTLKFSYSKILFSTAKNIKT